MTSASSASRGARRPGTGNIGGVNSVAILPPGLRSIVTIVSVREESRCGPSVVDMTMGADAYGRARRAHSLRCVIGAAGVSHGRTPHPYRSFPLMPRLSHQEFMTNPCGEAAHIRNLVSMGDTR